MFYYDNINIMTMPDSVGTKFGVDFVLWRNFCYQHFVHFPKLRASAPLGVVLKYKSPLAIQLTISYYSWITLRAHGQIYSNPTDTRDVLTPPISRSTS